MIIAERVRLSLGLTLIAALAAIPRWWLGRSQYIEYDGYWHIFIAQQDNWKNFWSDIYSNAHPPLYFLLLKLALWFGHSMLIYRSISLISGVLAVILIGLIARTITRSDNWAYLAALGYGLALVSVVMSCEVRSYMLSVFFILVSFLNLLYFFPRNATSDWRPRLGFAGAAILACLSHYFAFFYVGSAVILLLVRYTYLEWKHEHPDWTTEAVTFVSILAVIYALYRTHAGLYAQIQMHLLPFTITVK